MGGGVQDALRGASCPRLGRPPGALRERAARAAALSGLRRLPNPDPERQRPDRPSTGRTVTLPGGPSLGIAASSVAADTTADWDAAHICADPRTCDIVQAAEKTFALLTDAHFLKAFLTALGEAARTYHLPWLSALDAATVKAILLGVNAGDLIVTGFTFLAQYVVSAPPSISVSWTQLTKPKAPSKVTALPAGT